jgi:ATP-dependent RNA helicase DDX23/PRP28
MKEAAKGDSKPVFLTKKQREELALQRLQTQRQEEEEKAKQTKIAYEKFITGANEKEKELEARRQQEIMEKEKERRRKEENIGAAEHDHELKMIREHYLGNNDSHKRLIKPSEKFTRVFQFEWKDGDDTGKDDLNPLYSKRMKINALFGRGYLAGIDQREQRKDSNFLLALGEKRLTETQKLSEEEEKNLTEEEKVKREAARIEAINEFKRRQARELGYDNTITKEDGFGKHWTEKSLIEMNDRDWRILREDFDIRIQGGRATHPIRYWNEANLPESLMKAISALGFDKPSPIQRQAIPIGLLNRDIIGIAETGSGKTIAFLIPLLCYILKLPSSYIERCKEQGPLAIVMAPTRELAEQIEKEAIKLCSFTNLKTVSIVGGLSIEDQGFALRLGVQLVIGTPGRILDCLKHNLLVLNQCNYVVLDEADRMIDMGFEEQVVEVLENMGGLLKSEDEELAEIQLQSAVSGKAFYRVTAMFSATMSNEIEQIAKKYLRHPVIVKIGDEESGKNKRIEQHVIFLTENQKKGKMIEELKKLSSNDKAIIFVNARKAGDMLIWQLEAAGYKCGLLHGGKSQDQREETLDYFRDGTYQVLVATDVAARGLDIPDVSHVFNYDCPPKIQSYSHRIGRTGRAGKFGNAITFLTDTDTEIMQDLKQYLQDTNASIPQQLLQHPAAQPAPTLREDKR